MGRASNRPRAVGGEGLRSLGAALGVIVALLLQTPAMAQQIGQGPDRSLKPTYGAVTLRNGFLPDPFGVAVASGGPISAAQALGGNCVGFIARAPDYRLHYEAGESPLFISVWSRADTTLVISGPDGTWYCDDDGGVALDPLVRLEAPASGQYDIWIGTYNSADSYEADLFISEIGGAQSGQGTPQVAQPVADDTGQDVVVIETYRDWYVLEVAGLCIAATRANETDPLDAQIGATEVYVYRADGADRVTLVFGYPLSQNGPVTASIDGSPPFEFAPVDRIATLSGSLDPSVFADAMRGGVQMGVVSTSQSGETRTDAFSLLGYTAAINHAAQGCL